MSEAPMSGETTRQDAIRTGMERLAGEIARRVTIRTGVAGDWRDSGAEIVKQEATAVLMDWVAGTFSFREHTYPKGYDPRDPDCFVPVRIAWSIVDTLAPGAISDAERDLITGQIAFAIDSAHRQGQRWETLRSPSAPPPILEPGRRPT
jgi:hypothetical protein